MAKMKSSGVVETTISIIQQEVGLITLLYKHIYYSAYYYLLCNTGHEAGIHRRWDASPSQSTTHTHIYTPPSNLGAFDLHQMAPAPCFWEGGRKLEEPWCWRTVNKTKFISVYAS